jgi:hypothetical protein
MLVSIVVQVRPPVPHGEIQPTRKAWEPGQAAFCEGSWSPHERSPGGSAHPARPQIVTSSSRLPGPPTQHPTVNTLFSMALGLGHERRPPVDHVV